MNDERLLEVALRAKCLTAVEDVFWWKVKSLKKVLEAVRD